MKLSEYENKFDPMENYLVALSGGPDSLCVLALARLFSPLKHVRAVVVDHDLREDSAKEVHEVMELSESLGVPCKVIKVDWGGAPPTTGLQEKARDKRYKILLDEASKEGEVLVLGHNSNDQAETVLMRIARRSDPVLFSGMEERSIRPHGGFYTSIYRPLINTTRKEIESILEMFGLQHKAVRDPSNNMDKFTRVRVRKAMVALEDAGITVDDLCYMASNINELTETVGVGVELAMTKADASYGADSAYPLHYMSIAWTKITQYGIDMKERVIRNLVSNVNLNHVNLSKSSIFNVIECADSVNSDWIQTLGGCVFGINKQDGKLIVTRELGRMDQSVVDLKAREVWDNRFERRGDDTIGGPTYIGPAGSNWRSHRNMSDISGPEIEGNIAEYVFSGLPALYDQPADHYSKAKYIKPAADVLYMLDR